MTTSIILCLYVQTCHTVWWLDAEADATDAKAKTSA
jgi:hypothetical protein